MLDCFN